MQKELEVERVEVFITAVPVSNAHPDGEKWYRRHATQFYVRVHSQGLYGVGEGFAYGAPKAAMEVIENVIANTILGKDGNVIPERVAEMARATRICGRSGVAAFAVAAVEIALWDLLGKARGKPVYKLLGGAARTDIPAYISLPRFESPAALASESARLAAEGFKSIKLHQTEVHPVVEVRKAIGDGIALMLDTNCAWPEKEAVEIAKALEPTGLAWLEEPVWPPEDYPALARVKAATSLPISCGENEYSLVGFEQCMHARAADVLQPSAAKVGLLAMSRVAAKAREYSVPVIPHSFYFGPALAATAHFVATLDASSPMEMPLGEISVLETPVQAHDGIVSLSELPGLGVDLNLPVLDRHMLAKREFSLPI